MCTTFHVPLIITVNMGINGALCSLSHYATNRKVSDSASNRNEYQTYKNSKVSEE
jgi:hypothetical protein